MADPPPADRLSFLFGDDVDLDGVDLEDVEERSRLMAGTFGSEPEALQLLVHEVLANQILDDDPPEVWEAVLRMQAEGTDREGILGQLALVLLPVMHDAIGSEEPWDPDAYVGALGSLPLPGPYEIEGAVLECVLSNQGIDVERLEVEVMGRLGRPEEDRTVVSIVDRMVGNLIDRGRLSWLNGNRVVHAGALSEGVVLTRRPSDEELEAGAIYADFDLAILLGRGRLWLASGHELELTVEHGRLAVKGGEGWLTQFSAGDLLGVRITSEDVVEIEVLSPEPGVDESLVARLRAVYDQEVGDPLMPVEARSLVLALQMEDPATFGEPRAPLSELADAADLERRGGEVAAEEAVWHSALLMRRSARVERMLDSDPEQEATVLNILDVADLAAGIDPSFVPDIEVPLSASVLREVLEELEDPDVCSTVAVELFDSIEPHAPERAEAFISALVGAAGRPRDVATAALLAALHAEHTGDAAAAEVEFRRAYVADQDNPVVTDRLAWYASLRGDADRADKLWRSLEWSETALRELRVLRTVTAPEGVVPGRNEPCWCGSGRKYKQCHLGTTELPPLPDRVAWLWRKAVGFVERRSYARYDVIDVAAARAVDPNDEERFEEALLDPLVMDLVLVERDWFDRFLEEVGDLLPADEAELCDEWVLVRRTVYEVVGVDPGEGVEVRDLRTGEQIAVRERTSSQVATVGAMVCARAVPDGQSHQFLGGIVAVGPGDQAALLDLLDDGDAEAIAAWVAGSQWRAAPLVSMPA
jgi:hypothetical protein